MSSARVGVLALQGDFREHQRALEASGAEVSLVRREAELDGLDGLIIPGGESTSIGKLLRVFELLEPLTASIRGGLAVYGSCAGMIMLADKVIDGTSDQVTLGGIDMTVRRNAFGRQVASFEANIDVRGIAGDPVTGVFIRAPWVESVGNDVEVLASIDGHPVAVRQGRLLATSFHPEITGDRRVHELFVTMATS